MDKKRADHNGFIALDVKRLTHIEAERKRFLLDQMQKLPDINFMRCPRCGKNLMEKNVCEVTIIACPQCKGVWLDPERLTMVLDLFGDKSHHFLEQVTK